LRLEIYQSIINSTKAAYKQMYSLGTLNQSSFEILWSALDYQQDAVNGHIKASWWLKGEFPDLAKQNLDAQAEASPTVAWCYIAKHLFRTRDFVINRIAKCSKHRSLVLEWWQMERNVKVLSAYVTTLVCIREDLTQLMDGVSSSDNKSKEFLTNLINVLNGLCTRCVDEGMRSLKLESPVMFKLYEHILFGRLMVAQQLVVLREMMAQGAITEDEMEELEAELLEPSLVGLRSYVPSREHLQMAGAELVDKKYSRFLDIVVQCINFLTLEPVNR